MYEPASDSDTDGDAAQPGGKSDAVQGPDDDDGDIPMVETLRHEPEVLSPRPPLAPLGASAPSLQTQSRRQLQAVPPLSRSATARRAADDTDGDLAPLVARRDDQVAEDSPEDGPDAPASGSAGAHDDGGVDAEVVASGSGPDETKAQAHGDDNASVASSPPMDASDVPDDAVADDVLQSAAVLAAATEDTGLLRPDADVPEPPTAQEHAAAIDNIRWGLQDATVPRYEDALEDLVRPEEIVIATIPKEEAEAAERKMEEARLRAAAAQVCACACGGGCVGVCRCSVCRCSVCRCSVAALPCLTCASPPRRKSFTRDNAPSPRGKHVHGGASSTRSGPRRTASASARPRRWSEHQRVRRPSAVSSSRRKRS